MKRFFNCLDRKKNERNRRERSMKFSRYLFGWREKIEERKCIYYIMTFLSFE